MSGSPRIRPDYRSLFPALTGLSSFPISPLFTMRWGQPGSGYGSALHGLRNAFWLL